MDFQKFVDGIYPMTSVLSVEKRQDGRCGEIRIVTGNKRYIDSIERPVYDGILKQSVKEGAVFVPNSLYYKYVPKNPAFEDLCYRAAVLKEPVHTYVHPNKADLWFNVFVMPLEYEKGDLCYCAYTAKITDVSNVSLTTTHSTGVSDEVLKTCIKLHATTDFKTTLGEVIPAITELCGAEVCTIMLTDTSNGTVSILAKSTKEQSQLKTAAQFKNFYDIAMSWLDTMDNSDCIIIKSENDMKYIREVNHEWWLTLIEAGVESVVMFPLQYNGEVLGFIWATNFNTENTLRIKDALEITTFFISSQIASYNMVKRLEHLGFTDMLTGVSNRNAMNNRVSNIVSGEEYLSVPFGVVFVDLNGLKAMNDNNGHSAGDIMLKKTAIILQEQFIGDEIYRAGGDEFVVLISGCEREAFDQKVNGLRERSDTSQGVSFAVGAYFVDSGCDVRKAMRLADENMYKDKKEYYKRHPENDRRIQRG